MNWYLMALKNYGNFDGRSIRSEYWYFILFNILISFILLSLDALFGTFTNSGAGLLSTIYLLAVLIPGFAVGVRRLHDTNKSGWWILINIIPLIGPIVFLFFMIQDSVPFTNEYGTNPKDMI